MDRWEDQQRLKRMSKKITEAQSILKKEKRIGVVPLGQRRIPTASDGESRAGEHAGLGGAPYQPGDLFPAAVSRKQQPKKKRPEWDDGHKVYTEADPQGRREKEREREGGGVGGQRLRTEPVKVQVKKKLNAVRGALVKNIMHVEKIVAKAVRSPEKGVGKIACDLEEIQALRMSLCRGAGDDDDDADHKGKAQLAADLATAGDSAVQKAIKASREVKELRQSISKLSSILDSKLDLMMNQEVMDETECEVNLASPQRDKVGVPPFAPLTPKIKPSTKFKPHSQSSGIKHYHLE